MHASFLIFAYVCLHGETWLLTLKLKFSETLICLDLDRLLCAIDVVAHHIEIVAHSIESVVRSFQAFF